MTYLCTNKFAYGYLFCMLERTISAECQESEQQRSLLPLQLHTPPHFLFKILEYINDWGRMKISTVGKT